MSAEIDLTGVEEYDSIKRKIFELEEQSRLIREQNKLIRLENRQMVLEQRMLKEERLLLDASKGNNCEADDECFFDYFMIGDKDREHEESSTLLNKIIWKNNFVKLSVNKNFIILISPTQAKQGRPNLFLTDRISRKKPGQSEPRRNLLRKLGDCVMFNYLVPFLTMPEIQRIKALSKPTRKRVHPNLKFCLISKFENSIIFDKYRKHHQLNQDYQKELSSFIEKQTNFCLQFFLKLDHERIGRLAFNNQVGKDVQLFCICILKFFFGASMKLENINNYIFLEWSEYSRLIECLVGFIQKHALEIKTSQIEFDLARFEDPSSSLKSILAEAEFLPETSSKLQIMDMLGQGSRAQSEDEYQTYKQRFVPCTEFELDTKNLEPMDLLQVLFLRTMVKQLQVVQTLKRKLDALDGIVESTQAQIKAIRHEEIDLELFKNFMSQCIQEKFKVAGECEEVHKFQKKLKDMTIHAMTILEHLKNHADKDFFLIDVFLNFPREVLESGRSRKTIVDSQLSLIKAVHKLKRVDSAVDFDLFYELIHTKIFEMIRQNNAEIRQNEQIKHENTRKIREIEERIQRNEQKISGRLTRAQGQGAIGGRHRKRGRQGQCGTESGQLAHRVE